MMSLSGNWNRRLAAVALGFFFLVLLELFLRLLGIGGPARGGGNLLSDRRPIFVQEGEFFRTSEQARLFFLDQEFPARKGSGVIRLLIAGGSAAMGFPVESIFGLKQLLSVALPQVAPGYSYEVINAGGFGLASPEVVDVIVESLSYDLDAVVVMSGNNEFLRSRWPAAEKEARKGFPSVISRLALSRLLSSLVSVFRGGEEETGLHWEPHVVSEEERHFIERDFERNLSRIARMCQKNGVPLVLVTCPVNLRDFSPYGPSAFSEEERRSLERELEQDPAAAFSRLQEWKAKAPHDAWLKYVEAWALWLQAESREKGKSGEELTPELQREITELRAQARTLWQEARDLDPWPVRATSAINQVTRKVAAEMKVELADAEAEFEKVSAAEGGPGNALFFDHCHPNQFGQRLLGQVMIRSLGKIGALKLNQDWETGLWVWDQYRGENPRSAWAESYYRIAYETGINMGRPCRAQVYLRLALEFNPEHEKARRLAPRLAELGEKGCRLKGE